MPELPEVEVVRRGLEKIIKSHPRILGWKFKRKDLRFPMPITELQSTVGSRIQRITRRSKYLLWHTESGAILSHLGMTGNWRVLASGETLLKNDHVILTLEIDYENTIDLCYSDPRRFGYIDWIVKGQEAKHPRLIDLGPEPDDVDAQALFNLFKKQSRPIKAALMDAKVVVGIGNIYASEILFRAKIRPTRKAGKVSLKEMKSIVRATRYILNKAIRSGGSTISSYQNLNGKGGYQNSHRVYGKAGKACEICGQTILTKMISGRSTFWCPDCQS